jgi:hypothetical protein
MSNLLEQASLVMIPSGYKEDVVYSEIPLDGSGDLQFTRSSNGTRINSAGLVEDCPWNLIWTKQNYIWGAQLNIGSTAKPYFPTTDRLNVPRLTYQNGGGGCPSLLLEKQSTNVLLYSNTGDWGASGTITKTYNTTDLVSPDGTNNATKVVSSAGTGDTSVGFSVPDGAVTVSFWGKVASGTKTLVLDVRNNSSAVVSSSPVLTTEWQRFTLTNTVSGTGSSGAVWIYPNGAGTFYIYGAQAESSSYATSLILTNGASATRVADACFKTGISSLIGQTEGTFFLELSSLTNDVTNEQIALSDGTDSNTIKFVFGSVVGGVKAEGKVGGVGQFGITQSTSDYISNKKIAIGYKANDFVFYYNGVQVGVDTAGTVPTMSAFNFSTGASTFLWNGKVNEAIIFPTRLTNAELASLTTI